MTVLQRHVVDCSTGEESRIPFTAEELALREQDTAWIADVMAKRAASDEQEAADLAALEAGTADQETRDRVLVALLNRSA